jgi:hypothetical protein
VYDEYGTFWDVLPLVGNIVITNDYPPPSYRNISLGSIVDFSPGGTVYMVYNINITIRIPGRDNDDGTFRENVGFEMIYDGNEGFLMSSFGLTYDA